MRFIKTKDLQIVEEEKAQKKAREKAIESVPALETDLASMVFESMQDKMKIAQLESDLGNAVMEIMTMKMEVK